MPARRPPPSPGVASIRRLVVVPLAAALITGCSRLESPTNAADTATTAVVAPPTSVPGSTSVPESTTTSIEDPATTVVEATTSTSVAVATTETTAAAGVQVLQPEIVNRFPHDPLAFTQGLEFDGDSLLEGLGEFGNSSRRTVDPATGAVLTEVKLPIEQFGNGLTVSDGRLIQLTWQSGRAIIADPSTLEATGQFAFEGEGWGICAEADRLVMSNGSSRLTFRDPVTFAEVGTVDVRYDDSPVSNLNELECVDGTVWANRWLTSEILQIDPVSGAVTSIVDASSLIPTDQSLGQEDVLNGIAYRSSTDTFFVTGKHWNTLYEVRFVPAG